MNWRQKLGKKKKYDLVGVDSNGVNAFFVRKDLSKKINLKPKKAKKIFLDNIREVRNRNNYNKESLKLKYEKIIKI